MHSLNSVLKILPKNSKKLETKHAIKAQVPETLLSIYVFIGLLLPVLPQHVVLGLLWKHNSESSDHNSFFFFFHPIFDNLVAIILFSLSSIPLNFGNLIATIGFFFFPFEHFSFGHFIDLGRKIQAEGILVTSLLKFNSFLTPTITSFLFPLSSFFVRILAIMLSKFASLLNLPNNF